MEPNSIDAVTTDSPYGLEFMNKGWDRGVPTVEYWELCLMVAKPGAHLLAFGGTRTYHRLACAIEDAGWEIRDCLMWLYGSGFKKGLDIGKAIDELKGETREVIGSKLGMPGMSKDGSNQSFDSSINTYGSGSVLSTDITEPKPKEAIQWDGWHTGLTPAWEPIILARKSIPTTIAKNVLEYGTGGINIDGCRIEAGPDHEQKCKSVIGLNSNRNGACFGEWKQERTDASGKGRWPKNVILDEESAAMLDEQSGVSRSVQGKPRKGTNGDGWGMSKTGTEYTDSGGASRFFYTAKSSKSEREGGLAHMPDAYQRGQTKRKNTHPTVKPIDLMRYLVRLITPLGGTVLDPFAGSGSTIVAAKIEGFNGIGIEKEKEYVNIARHRVEHARFEAQQIGLWG
jgi:site-specific DNA-methyltransferase (adenine-specific)